MLEIQKSRQSEAVDSSLPSSKEYGSSHVAWRNVMHFRELDAFVALFECPNPWQPRLVPGPQLLGTVV